MSDTVRVLCAWCKTTIRAGDAAREASHGICVRCAADLQQSGDDPPKPPADDRRDDPQRS